MCPGLLTNECTPSGQHSVRWSAGEAINPKNLSLFERTALRMGRNYNKQLDREDLYDDQFRAAQMGGPVGGATEELDGTKPVDAAV